MIVMTLQDRSNYFKGLLILIGKDKTISEPEKNNLRKLANILGFNKEFCDGALSELLENEYIIEDPPVFSNSEIANSFIIDGIRIGFSDKALHIFELNWLKSVADKNSVDYNWCMTKYEEYKEEKSTLDKIYFEIEKIL
ncbi:MAG: hypothetical protein RDU14_02715 [Melioribacteraceae bacterium]|nr:hypothetical protein [Melioribacteraceae bacterium]